MRPCVCVCGLCVCDLCVFPSIQITNQMITNCKNCINGGDAPERLWDKDAEKMMENLEACLRLNEAYQEIYRVTKEKLLTMPKGKQFDFSEAQIFSKFDLFCRRVIKLLDMFGTIAQFRSLANNHLEGMEGLIESFFKIINEFKAKRHDLLDYHNNKVRIFGVRGARAGGGGGRRDSRDGRAADVGGSRVWPARGGRRDGGGRLQGWRGAEVGVEAVACAQCERTQGLWCVLLLSYTIPTIRFP